MKVFSRTLRQHSNFTLLSGLFFIYFMLSTARAQGDATDLPMDVDSYGIIPVPAYIESRPGSFKLTGNTRLLINSNQARDVAVYFQSLIIPATGFKLDILESEAPQDNTISLLISDKYSAPEAYELSINPRQVIIRAASSKGLFYGIQSVRQMLPAEIESAYPFNSVEWRLAGVLIRDEPRYPYRGMHLDVSRHFFSKEFIKRYIDFLALHKMNVFHWHLTDDQGWRIEIKKYPRLTTVGSTRPRTMLSHPYDREPRFYDDVAVSGFYSQDDIREIVAYARQRQVTIVPEIDVPGHTSALLAAYPELACVKKDFVVKTEFHIFRDVMCPTEKSFSFLKDVFTEVASLFPGPYIHIGGDEVIKDQWKACASCTELMQREGLSDYQELQSYFVHRVEEIINGLGKKMAGWEEILEGGINPSATIMTWLKPGEAVKAVKAGHDVVISSSERLYFNQFESLSLDEPMSSSWQPPISLKDVYEFDPLPAGLTASQAQRIIGAQGHVWGNFIKTPAQVEHAALPRMSALSEVLWSPSSSASWPDFLLRLDRFYKRLDRLESNASRAVYKVSAEHRLINSTMELTLQIEGHDHAIRYTLDGSTPNARSALYSGPLVLEQTTTVRAVGQNRRTGELYGDFRLTFVKHKALGKSLVFAYPPKSNYQPGPLVTILDGAIAYDRIFHPAEWAEFNDSNLDAIIDFETITSFHSVGFGFDAGQYRRLNQPQGVELLVSDNGETWKSIAFVNAEKVRRSSPFLNIDFPEVAARYLRVVGINNKKVFSTRLEKTLPVSIFIDEIIVH